MEEDELRSILGEVANGKGGWAHQIEIAVEKLAPLMANKAPVSGVPCGAGLSCQDEVVEQLIKLAADMATRQGFPSEYAADWPISKHTQQKTLNEIERNMEIIQKKMADWSYEVRQLANKLHKAR